MCINLTPKFIIQYNNSTIQYNQQYNKFYRQQEPIIFVQNTDLLRGVTFSPNLDCAKMYTPKKC